MGRSFALLTPCVVGRRWLVEIDGNTKTLCDDKAESIVERIVRQGGYTVIREHRKVLNGFMMADLPSELKKVDLSSGPVVLLILQKEGKSSQEVIDELLALCGPEDPQEAREADMSRFGSDMGKWSLRGAFGTIGVENNGIYVSASEAQTEQDIKLFFYEKDEWEWERALVIGELRNPEDFVVIARTTFEKLTAGDRFPPVTGSTQVFIVEGFGVVEALQADDTLYFVSSATDLDYATIAGAEASFPLEKLLVAAPDEEERLERELGRYGFFIVAKRKIQSKRLIFMDVGSRLITAFCVTKAAAQQTFIKLQSETGISAYASPEIRQAFSQINLSPSIDSEGTKLYLRNVATKGTEDSKAQLVQSLIVIGLAELCKVKPAGSDAIRFLGEWLLKNNTDRAAAQRAEAWIELRHSIGVQTSPKKKRTSIQPRSNLDRGIIFVLGGPGSGKGTVCSKLKDQLSFKHVSTGDLLRKEVELETERGRKILETMKAGELVENEIVINLLKQAIEEAVGPQRFLVDGFPREMSQVQSFEDAIGPCSFVLNLECSDEVMQERLMKRGRKDDSQETIQKRLVTFKERSLPVIEHFKKLGKVHTILQGNVDETPGEVFERALEMVASEFVIASCSAKVQKLLFGTSPHCHFPSFIFLDVDALIREERTTGSPIGVEIRQLEMARKPMSRKIKIDLLSKQILRKPSSSSFLIFGFPSSIQELEDFQKRLGPVSYGLQIGEASFGHEISAYLRALAKLRVLKKVNLDHGELLRKAIDQFAAPDYILNRFLKENGEVSSIEDVTRTILAAPALQKIFEFPWIAQEDQLDVHEKLGKPLAVVSDDYDHPAVLQGYFRRVQDFVEPTGEVVIVAGSAYLTTSVRQALVRRIAEEFGFSFMDFRTALEQLNQCGGTWEADTSKNLREFDMVVHDKIEEERKVLEKELLTAKRAMVQRAAQIGRNRGLILLLDDDLPKETCEVLNPDAIFLLSCKDRSTAIQRLQAQHSKNAAKETEAVAEEPDWDAAIQDEERRLGSLVDDGKSSTLDCSSSSEDELLEALRDPFKFEIFLLSCSSNESKRNLAIELLKVHGLVLIQIAEVYNREMNSKSASGEILRKHFKSGTSIPLEVSIPLIRSEMCNAARTGAHKFLLTDFPRSDGQGLPLAHDQLFALEKLIGPVRGLIEYGSSPPRTGLTEMMKNLKRYVGLNAGEEGSSATAFISRIEAQEAEARRIDAWVPGDGSPEALLQDVLDKYKPSRIAARTCEEYFAQFALAEGSRDEVHLAEIVSKMKAWGLENDPIEHLEGPLVTKAKWFEYVLQHVLLLDEYQETIVEEDDEDEVQAANDEQE